MNIIRVLAALGVALLFASEAEASKLYIREYVTFGFNSPLAGGTPPIATEPGTDQSPVDFSGGVISSAAFAATTHLVRIVCDVQCSVLFGASPQTAATSNAPLAAFVPEYFGVTPGQIVSVIAHP